MAVNTVIRVRGFGFSAGDIVETDSSGRIVKVQAGEMPLGYVMDTDGTTADILLMTMDQQAKWERARRDGIHE